MLTADTITRSEAFAFLSHARAPHVLLPVDPGEEELARDFSLSEWTSRRSGAVVEMITGVALLCSFAYYVRPAASSIAIGRYRPRFSLT
jgi:hypothetical protein